MYNSARTHSHVSVNILRYRGGVREGKERWTEEERRGGRGRGKGGRQREGATHTHRERERLIKLPTP